MVQSGEKMVVFLLVGKRQKSLLALKIISFTQNENRTFCYLKSATRDSNWRLFLKLFNSENKKLQKEEIQAFVMFAN